MITFDTTVADSGATVIEATGRLDMVAAPQLKALVQSAVGEAKTPVVVELEPGVSSWTPPGWLR